jgi:hypothetical protein
MVPMMRARFLLAAALLSAPACRVAPEQRIRQALQAGGTVELPPGTIEVSSEIVIPEGARGVTIRGAASGTVLHATGTFRGRAVLVARGAQGLRLERFTIDGNRPSLEKPAGLPPSNVPFSRFTPDNGILVEDAASLVIAGVNFRQVAGFPILVGRSRDVRIERVTVEDSGSGDGKGHNNATGGILLEEGVERFEVRNCRLVRVRGNGIWTHSNAGSPRARDGVIADNEFEELARDAIQVGHATAIRVENNHGRRIGYPTSAVYVWGQAVALDTAGNTDHSAYVGNRFEEVDGRCIDLDGFHDGEVRGNTCVNRGPRGAYHFGNFGIGMNNTDPGMQSSGIVIADNEIDGTVYGGLFLIGSGHQILNNRLVNVNLARCTPSKPGCVYWPGEPDLLSSGIYLASHAQRPAVTRDNVIRGNTIRGFGMQERCIVAAPGVSLEDNRVGPNVCLEK